MRVHVPAAREEHRGLSAGLPAGISEDLAAAIPDYRWLLDRGYAVKATAKLVGDRHRLEADERIILFRGVASAADSDRRRALLGEPLRGNVIILDLYNVAFTLLHYRIGKPCFLSTDGLLRDAGANYGRLPREELLSEAFREIAAYLAGMGLSAEAFLDAPVSHSGGHAADFRSALAREGVLANVTLAQSADGAILRRIEEQNEKALDFGSEKGGAVHSLLFVASSDSALLDRSPAAWDLARSLLISRYGAVFPDLAALCSSQAMTTRGPQETGST